jgi:energy-coupling factor transporter ATP-binding protein EcfA2
MKVSKILIKGFQQFENFQLDLTNPETGEPLEKICLIGPNGTGKSTILACVLWILRNMSDMPLNKIPSRVENHTNSLIHRLCDSFQKASNPETVSQPAFIAIKCHTSSESFYVYISFPIGYPVLCCQASIESTEEWKNFWNGEMYPTWGDFCLGYRMPELPVPKLSGLEDLIAYEQADQSIVLLQDPPQAPLNEALQFFQEFPVYHAISVAESSSFWKLLAYLLKKWESDYLSFLHEPQNSDRSIRQLEAEFSQTHQKILPKIAELWNRILDKCGLEFDLERAVTPVQLNESLQAYVKSKNTGEQLQYNQLSSGIRNYIFKLGHIQSLYFDRQIKRGFLLIDEPENCLYPDLLYDLMDDYWSLIENTQMFVSTHSPIVAAQFEPYERFHLDFDDRGYVTATRGVSPIGDDPNDLLYRDFQVRSIYGKKGLEKWNRYLELRHLIPETLDPETKRSQMQEYLAIGNAYNFDPQ